MLGVDPTLIDSVGAVSDEVARAMHASPEAALSTIPTLAAADRQRQFEQFNAPLPALDAALTVHGVFARRVAQDAMTTFTKPLADRLQGVSIQLVQGDPERAIPHFVDESGVDLSSWARSRDPDSQAS